MKKLFTLILALWLPAITFAWHANGHQTAGTIAYFYLKTHDPATLNKVITTLKMHPWHDSQLWKTTLHTLPADQQDLGLFLLASTFPDDAKKVTGDIDGDPTHKKWHYIDYPFVPQGQRIQAPPPELPNAKQRIDYYLASLPKMSNGAQKAHDLAWLFHIIEDIHQPLHTSALFDQHHPRGDGGGNDTYIKLGNSSTKLHDFWDDLVKGATPAICIHNAQALLAKPQYREDNLKELLQNRTTDSWMIKESSPLAQSKAYLNGTVNGIATNPTQVDGTYQQNAAQIGERRVVLAGIRLAKLLKTIYA